MHERATDVRLDYRTDVSSLLKFHLDRAIGREQEWRRIVEFAARRDPGYLVIEAPGGFGKSTLVAQLVGRRESGQWPAPTPNLIFFFVRARGGDTPLAFLQAVNSQLLGLLGLGGGVPLSLGELQVQFSELWSSVTAATRADMPLLLVVDGLDEISEEDTAIVDLLPAGLRDFVHVVITSRPNPDVRERVDREHPLRWADELRLHTFDEEGVASLLRRYGADPDVAAGLAVPVLRLTRGEPLFARFIAEEVGREGPGALERLERDPPADVEQYFHDQLRHLRDAASGDLSWDLLGVFTVAHGPLEPRELADLLDCPLREVLEALGPIDRYLLGEDALEFFHRNLRASVESRGFTARELEGYRDRLLGWSRRYGADGWPLATPRYVLAHHAEQLRDAGRLDELFALIDIAWLRCRRERERLLAGFARDVEFALKCAHSGRPPLLAQEIRLCFVAATIGAVSTGAPPAAIAVLAELGHVEEAQAYASLVQGWSRTQSEAHRHLARGLLRRGEREAARAALARSLDTLASERFDTGVQEEYVYTDREVSALARALADVGDKAGLERLVALSDALGLLAPAVRASAALGFALGGHPDRAVAIVEELLAEAQQTPFESVQTSARVDRYVERDSSLEMRLPRIAGALAAAGEVERAAAIADEALAQARVTAPGESAYADLLSAWARALADGPLRSRAHAAARAALEASTRRAVPEDAAEALSALGDAASLERAFVMLMRERPESLTPELVTALARVGSCDRALEALGFLPDLRREQATADVAASLAAASRLEEAFALAEAATVSWSPTNWSRAGALAAIAEQLLKAGRVRDAEATARRAIRESQQLHDEGDRSSALGKVAEALRNVGASDRWPAVAEQAGDLESLARLGRIEDALARAHSDIAGVEANNLYIIGQAAHEAGHGEVVPSILERIHTIADRGVGTARITALLALGELLARTGRLEEAAGQLRRAVEATLALRPEDVRDWWHRAALAMPLLLAHAAAALARMGEHAEAVRVASLARDLGPQEAEAELDSARALALDAAGLHEDAVKAARRILRSSEDNWPPWHEHLATALSVIPAEEAVAWVGRIATRPMEPGIPEQQYGPLSVLAVAWHCVGRPEEALGALRAAFRATRLCGYRSRFLDVLGLGAPILAGVDDGETLGQVSAAITYTAEWWNQLD